MYHQWARSPQKGENTENRKNVKKRPLFTIFGKFQTHAIYVGIVNLDANFHEVIIFKNGDFSGKSVFLYFGKPQFTHITLEKAKIAKKTSYLQNFARI